MDQGAKGYAIVGARGNVISVRYIKIERDMYEGVVEGKRSSGDKSIPISY